MEPVDKQCWQPLVCIDMIETNETYIRDPYVRDADDYYIWRIPSLLRGSVGICATSEAILIVLVLYLLVPPTGVELVVIYHTNPRKNNVNLGVKSHQ